MDHPTLLQRIQRRYLEILGLLILALPLALFLFLYKQTDGILYFKYGPAGWAEQRPGYCSDSRKALVYADMRPGADKSQPLELSCENATALPYSTHYAQTRDGLSIHYKRYPATAPGQPLLLYVPGITSTWLDGSRFVPLARRLGFELAVMELRNHGVSGNNGAGATYGCREKEDVLAVVADLLKDQPERSIYLWGTSMGSMSILNAAPELQQRFPRWRAVVLENPPSSLREVMEERSPGYPGLLYDWTLALTSWRAGVDFESCAPVALAPKLQVPALVTVAEHDTLTPPDMVKKVYAALPDTGQHRFIRYPHGAHAAVWNGQPERYEADMLAFWAAQQP
ncbi:MAG: alpha/beta fold hydrolase [Candidatus Sericytochromatia bacterium]|nr:alpha/beta fold hydrolase [Candidatus Sericytochromatia bacterium]